MAVYQECKGLLYQLYSTLPFHISALWHEIVLVKRIWVRNKDTRDFYFEYF